MYVLFFGLLSHFHSKGSNTRKCIGRSPFRQSKDRKERFLLMLHKPFGKSAMLSGNISVLENMGCNSLSPNSVRNQMMVTFLFVPLLTLIAEFLQEAKTLDELGCPLDSQTFWFLKKYSVFDDEVTQAEPLILAMVYSSFQSEIVGGRYPLTRNDVKDFAALQLQITYGNCDPAKHPIGWSSLHIGESSVL